MLLFSYGIIVYKMVASLTGIYFPKYLHLSHLHVEGLFTHIVVLILIFRFFFSVMLLNSFRSFAHLILPVVFDSFRPFVSVQFCLHFLFSMPTVYTTHFLLLSHLLLYLDRKREQASLPSVLLLLYSLLSRYPFTFQPVIQILIYLLPVRLI